MRVRLACIATVVFTGNVLAQSVADVVPADSVLYVGWRGSADPGPLFAKSRWAAVLKESHLGQLIDETIPAMGVEAQRKYPRYGTTWAAIATSVQGVIRRPSAAFVGFEGERPRGGIICRGGADNTKLTQAFEQIVSVLPPMLSARVVTPGDAVGLVLGYAPEATVEGGMDQQADFKKGVAACVADPNYVVFVNVKAALEAAGQAVAAHAPPENDARFRRFVEASGLSGVNAYTAAAGFAGTDWQIDAFVDAPSPRKGLFDVDEPTPWDKDLIARIPASSNSVTVLRLNANASLQRVRDVATATDPAAGDMVDKAIGAATMAVGKNLQNDLLASLGDQWAVYTSNEIGGTAGTGLIAVNKLANPLKAKQAMAAVSIFMSNSAKNLIQSRDYTIAGRTTKVGDLTVYYVATPLVSPAWAIKDGYLYMGAFPQTVIAAAQFAGPSLTTTEAFKQVATPASGAKTDLAFSITDVKATLGDGYALAMIGSRTVLGMSDVFLAPTPEPVLPTLAALQAQAAPVTTMYWTSDAGIHMRSRSPYPGAETVANLSISNLYFGNAPVMASILLPSLNRAREQANRIKSMSNLRQIGLASLMYANGHRGDLPPDFGELVKTMDIAADVFFRPGSDVTLPAVPAGANRADALAAWVNEHSDYVYLGAGKKAAQMKADGILAYENPAGQGEGINVLFLDGHVEFLTTAMVPERFAAAGVPSPLP